MMILEHRGKYPATVFRLAVLVIFGTLLLCPGDAQNASSTTTAAPTSTTPQDAATTSVTPNADAATTSVAPDNSSLASTNVTINGTNASTATTTVPQTTAAAGDPPLGSDSNNTITFLTLTMLLPISSAGFNEQSQQIYRAAIARASGLPIRFVVIVSVEESAARRRLLATAVAVQTRVGIPEDVAAASVAARLTEEAINAQLPPELQGTLVVGATLPPCGFAAHICAPRPPTSPTLPAPTALPSGVTELGPRREEAGEELGGCVCDLLAGLCDANCECDAECDEDERAAFSADYGVPLKSQGFQEDIGACVDKDQFLRINAPIIREDSPVCVVVNNNPSLGDFFTPPGASVTDDEVRLAFTEQGVGPWVPYTPPTQPDQPSYQVGMRIPVAIASTELGSTDTDCDPDNCVPGVYGPLGFLSLPFPGPNGRCVPGNLVRYWEGTEEAAACLEAGPVATACAPHSPLSLTHHAKNILIAIRPTQLEQIPEWASKSKWRELALQVWVRAEPGAAGGQAGNGSAGWFRAQGLPTPAFYPQQRVCANVMTALHLALQRDGSGGIAAATAVITLEHVPAEAGGMVEARQRFSVAFLDPASAARTNPEDLAPLQRSGRPGYVAGKAVGAGYGNSSLGEGSGLGEAVERLVQGLSLPRMALPDGRCRRCAVSAVAGAWECAEEGAEAGEEGGVSVLFGQDLELGCHVALSRLELEAFCTQGQLHPLLRYDQRLRVAIWGDSDPANVFEWLPAPDANPRYLAKDREPQASQNWDARGVCSRAPTSVHYQILTADVGNVKNPQRKILGARIQYGLADLQALHPDPNTRATYMLSASVSFLRIDDGGSVEVVPPAPSLLPVLPDDIFYPFSNPAPRPLPSRFLAALCLGMAVLGQHWLRGV